MMIDFQISLASARQSIIALSGDITLSIRTLSILAFGAGLALTTAACSGTGDRTAAGAPTTSSAPTAAVPAPTATKATDGSTAGPAATAGQGCPVTAATLLAAMKADKLGASQLKKGATLGKPECYAGYVLVRQTSINDANGNPVGDDEVATFKYESGSWEYLFAGTAAFCEGMPATTRKHFESNFPSGCGA